MDLRPRGDHGVDAGVAVFLNGNGMSAYDLANLHGRIRRMLAKIYPSKKPEDFTIPPRTLGIVAAGVKIPKVPV